MPLILLIKTILPSTLPLKETYGDRVYSARPEKINADKVAMTKAKKPGLHKLLMPILSPLLMADSVVYLV